MTVKSLHLGNNYGPSATLQWCHYDADRMANWVLTHAPEGSDVDVRLDRTTAQLEDDLAQFVARLGPDDFGILSYSGHGSWVQDQSGDEPDGRDEVWVGQDLTYLKDDRINRILAPAVAPIVVYSDSCFSGTVTREMMFRTAMLGGELTRRYYPSEYGAGTGGQVTGRIAGERGASPLLLMSGCNDVQYSYESGRPPEGGVFTTVLLASYVPGMTFRELHRAVRQVLPNASFPQSPRLYGSRKLRGQPVFPA